MAKRLYFIWDGDKYVKVGASEDPERRLKQLQTSSPRKLTLVWSFPFENADDESFAHEMFQWSHVMGEWFRVTGPFREFCAWMRDVGTSGTFREAYEGYIDDQVLWDQCAGILYDQNEWAHAVQRRAGA